MSSSSGTVPFRCSLPVAERSLRLNRSLAAVLATLQANGIRLEQISAVERHRHTDDAVEQHTVVRKQST